MVYNKELGKAGEEAAQRFLKAEGYRIVETNFRCRLGEMDIICMDGDYLVFIEVKTRSSCKYGYPIESITRRKKNSLIKVAYTYLAFKKLKEIDLRFDVVEVIKDNRKGKNSEEIRLIRNAFSV